MESGTSTFHGSCRNAAKLRATVCRPRESRIASACKKRLLYLFVFCTHWLLLWPLGGGKVKIRLRISTVPPVPSCVLLLHG